MVAAMSFLSVRGSDMKRLWEVDSARGVAIIMMVISNGLFDLHLFVSCGECYAGFWLYFARVTASLFVLLVGVSLTLSYSRTKAGFNKYLLRGARIFGYGLLITAVTWMVLGEQAILFGILHLIGLSIILAYPFLKQRFSALVMGVLIIILGLAAQVVAVDWPWLLWLGLQPVGFMAVDYTPLLPWFGLVLIGIFLGNTLFSGGRGLKPNTSPLVRFLSLLGRRSLFIYLAHQPILVAILHVTVGIQL